MSEPIIKAEKVGKRYRIRHQGRLQYQTLRDSVAAGISRLFRPALEMPGLRPSEEDFWALKDVSFELQQGEALGIVGPNGSGKSTLLKVLSRITEPTEGRITLGGRVASLLEVGTGFHPELTGRENIYLNGAILGMAKTEIRSKFDEIVAFAEVEKFLDTPVKRYSSGMYVRLAFAVAAHLEPEILIVDEVLAVGDVQFQQKCMGKMQQVSQQEGRTVLFVSHNMAAVQNLCTTALILNGGTIRNVGPAAEITKAYVKDMARNSPAHSAGKYLHWARLVGEDRQTPQQRIASDEPMIFRVQMTLPEAQCVMTLVIKGASQEPLFELFDPSFSPPYSGQDSPIEIAVAIQPSFQLVAGNYHVDLWMGNRMYQRIEHVRNITVFEVVETNTSHTLPLSGNVRCASRWTLAT